MRDMFKGVCFLVAALPLFFALTPELAYVQGYEDIAGFSSFVDGDTEFALCSSFTVAVESHLCIGYLPLFEEKCFLRCPIISISHPRAPPSL